MAAFGAGDLDRLDYQLMQNSPISLHYSREVLARHVAELEGLGYWCPTLDCLDWRTEEGMHAAFARVLDFPDYYGRNLSALNDCLWDLPMAGRTGIALVLIRFNAFSKLFPRVAWHVLDIIADNSRGYLLTGNRFFALVQSDDPRVRFKPVGGMAPEWNPREWFDKDRGE